jgi:hypothetical protein
MITLSIDVTRLDRARFKEITRKNGDKAVFVELVLIDTPNSEHGDFMVKQGVTKEERQSRVEMPILGNGKHVGTRPQEKPRTQAPARSFGSTAPDDHGGDDDIPF